MLSAAISTLSSGHKRTESLAFNTLRPSLPAPSPDLQVAARRYNLWLSGMLRLSITPYRAHHETYARAISTHLCRLSEQLSVGTLQGRRETQAALRTWSMTRAVHSELIACELLPLMIRVTGRAGGTANAHSILDGGSMRGVIRSKEIFGQHRGCPVMSQGSPSRIAGWMRVLVALVA